MLLILLSIIFSGANAEVGLRRGNFNLSYIDMEYKGGIEPKIQRVYSSTSEHIGVFGYGWSTVFDTRLLVDPDGSVVVIEYGGGAEIRFLPVNSKAMNPDQMISDISKATNNKDPNYLAKLKENGVYRSSEWNRLVVDGRVKRMALKEGQQLTSTQFGYQYVTRIKNGYIRVKDADTIQKFDDLGRMVQVANRTKQYMNISWNSKGKIDQIVDNDRRKMKFNYDSKNCITSIVGESGKTAVYKCDSKLPLLVYSKDSNGVVNTYKYANDRFKNLVEVGYPPEKSPLKVSYFGPEKDLRIKSLTNVDESSYEYDYQYDKKNPKKYSVSVVMKDSRGNVASKQKYDFFSEVAANGEIQVVRQTENVDGNIKETVFDPQSGQPLKVTENGRTIDREYDNKGRLIKEVNPEETISRVYDPKSGLLKRLTTKTKSGSTRWNEYTYDQKTLLLTSAKNSSGLFVKVIWDGNRRPLAMVDHKNRKLTFQYNQQGKPISIKDSKVGTLRFTWKNSGEIDRVDGDGGKNVQSEITGVMQTFFELLRPANITM